MTIGCCVTDCYLQNVAISTLLEVINHSQSLAFVIEDKTKRYKSSGHNPFFGKLQMVTVPPIAPGILKVMAEKTDFYQVFPWEERGRDPGPLCPDRLFEVVPQVVVAVIWNMAALVALEGAPEDPCQPLPSTLGSRPCFWACSQYSVNICIQF